MCGIAGIVSSAPDHSQNSVADMLSTIAHRGPDGEGMWSDEHAALGQRRLTIIDLSDRAQQPLISADGSTVLICNGEIYNYRDLKKAQAPSYPYKSDTDVEVILPLFARYGRDCVNHLDGMFALALWETKTRRLLLARDRIGEKPLYFAQRDGKFAFASEIKALLRLDWVDRRIDEDAVTQLLAYQSLPAPATIYRGIRQLGPSEQLTWKDGRIERNRYWRIDFSRRRARSWSDARNELEDILTQTVRNTMISDVPLGVMLSGGVDSSTIARYARDHAKEVRTFCIGPAQNAANDEEFTRAAAVAKILGTEHHQVMWDGLSLSDLVRPLAYLDQPMWSFPVLYADRLAQLMRKEVKVVLSGNGADEIFGGYAPYARLPLVNALQRAASPLHRVLSSASSGDLLGRLARLAGAGRMQAPARRGHGLDFAARMLVERLTTDEFAARWKDADPGRIAVEEAQMANADTLLDAVLVSDLMVCHQHGHCVIPDMTGMANGLEIRSPFLNHHIIDFATSLPQHMLVGRRASARQAKLLLKRLLAERLPSEIVYAKKIGFGYNIRLDKLIEGPWRPGIEELLFSGKYLELGIFTKEGARWALENSYPATCILISFAIWAETALFAATTEQLIDRLETSSAASAPLN